MDAKKLKEFERVFHYSKDRLEQPIIKSFLALEENQQLLKEFRKNPSEENQHRLDDAFRSFFNRVRKIKYFNNLIHFLSIDFDKKIRKNNARLSLTLDKPMIDETTTTIKDNLPDPTVYSDLISNPSLLDEIEDHKLYRSLESLTEKQLQVIELLYAKKLTNNEAAYYLNTTPQNVTNIHTKALKKLKNMIE
ncbi:MULTISPECIES: RNA polymerase sigma factor [Bacillus]|uniref:RNA polymerase sigma factor n=1 Tax=Bacillus TaxID=1386 RepID=UPI002DC053D7|nr:sigma factor-like helix-turn-helix DNA-binding protein [Bacillus tropicus]MEC2921352.1 sigma factor-like helix-turn-helix DNA-binding protein [Bacillus tropicus]MEC2926621.1 sigma factor-like helix-turn-helix DNA-binding protein [Bacillus tropicus]MEC2956213.1 sigma factor-like helix-turn-helix DNA-binding protein [Bacillus tropicus]MEC3051487.1 sigma factor-like helix-turn-helix DNA-binding protein [Bacillus tropicus]MEC3078107.1 sigma factor-like helix-turn-helix DNA-binding protein [Baci